MDLSLDDIIKRQKKLKAQNAKAARVSVSGGRQKSAIRKLAVRGKVGIARTRGLKGSRRQQQQSGRGGRFAVNRGRGTGRQSVSVPLRRTNLKARRNNLERFSRKRNAIRNQVIERVPIYKRNDPKFSQGTFRNSNRGSRKIRTRKNGVGVRSSDYRPSPSGPSKNAIGINKQVRQRILQRLAKQRVQRARITLSKKIASPGRSFHRRKHSEMGTAAIGTGRIRLSKYGFVTNKSPEQRRVARLNVQEKISRAQKVRNAGTVSAGQATYSRMQSFNFGQTRARGGNRGRRGNGRGGRGGRSQLRQFDWDPTAVTIQVPNDRMFLRREHHQSTREMPPSYSYAHSSRQYDFAPPYNPMYPSYDAPIPRMQIYNQHAAGYMQESQREGLDPDIQHKITYIQNKAHRTGSMRRENFGPDYRTPVVSSGLKLGDRFRMMMHND